MTRRRQDEDADQLLAELISLVRAKIKRSGTTATAVAQAIPVPASSLHAFLNGYGISLDSFAVLARWVGRELVLREKAAGDDPAPDAAVVAVMDGLADADRNEANGAEVACWALAALADAGFRVVRTA